MISTNANDISLEQLRPGLYIHLDLKWMDHPFAFSSFKIKNQQQIEMLRKLGLERIRYTPEKSDCEPLEVLSPTPTAAPAAVNTIDAADIELMQAKQQRMAQLKQIRNNISRVEYAFMRAADSVRNITRNIHSRPHEALAETSDLVDQMVTSILKERDVLIHAMGGKLGDNVYFHSLNVTVLSLMLAKTLNMDSEQMRDLGMAAMLHDIGKTEIPYKILAKNEALTKAESTIFQQHCDFGVVFAKKMGLSDTGLTIIAQHHEHMDGSGYPRKLTDKKIAPLSRLVAIVNAYDNLCNPSINPANAYPPAEALAYLFTHKRAQFDTDMLSAFIRSLGVYPPGSIVQLSNEMFGLVLSGNSDNPLKPNILVYDPSIPREEAVIISLTDEPDLKIDRSLRPKKLPVGVREYLNPRTQVTYYFDSQEKTD